MKYLLPALLAAAALAGCATPTPKQYAATGGSRADGVVRLSYEHSVLEVPQMNEAQGVALATARCQTWGYTGAEAFGGTTRTCNMPGSFGGGCAQYVVSKEFQCTGTGAAPQR